MFIFTWAELDASGRFFEANAFDGERVQAFRELSNVLREVFVLSAVDWFENDWLVEDAIDEGVLNTDEYE